MDYTIYKGPIISILGGSLAVLGGLMLYLGFSGFAFLFGFIGFILVWTGIFFLFNIDHRKYYLDSNKKAKQTWE